MRHCLLYTTIQSSNIGMNGSSQKRSRRRLGRVITVTVRQQQQQHGRMTPRFDERRRYNHGRFRPYQHGHCALPRASVSTRGMPPRSCYDAYSCGSVSGTAPLGARWVAAAASRLKRFPLSSSGRLAVHENEDLYRQMYGQSFVGTGINRGTKLEFY
jgi:hypothetical protein